MANSPDTVKKLRGLGQGKEADKTLHELACPRHLAWGRQSDCFWCKRLPRKPRRTRATGSEAK